MESQSRHKPPEVFGGNIWKAALSTSPWIPRSGTPQAWSREACHGCHPAQLSSHSYPVTQPPCWCYFFPVVALDDSALQTSHVLWEENLNSWMILKDGKMRPYITKSLNAEFHIVSMCLCVSLCVCVSLSVYVSPCVFVGLCVWVYVSLCVCVYEHLCVSVCLSVCMGVSPCVCVSVCLCYLCF